ncbi:FGGY family carbohydrate kinase [Saccharopolyspora spinosa]|uniref:Carbohydrate kinase of FGGY family protein n=1 Tax=Saccharopolyspora spinosa TaxID=60894 RepID=A0A2N3XPW7_SACSN|nr:FGGY family carbohydrate kinase [Saccharopolyspora spinosa]PKW12640.1 carbohydrate kinase of FGGY family protein [Saccharopolyspora spinosa]
MTTIGIDAGTSVVSSVAYSADGTELAVTRRPTRVEHPRPGCAGQNMPEVWSAVADTVAELVAGLGTDVAALTVTAQGDGCWLVDAAGHPTRPALLCNDARASPVGSYDVISTAIGAGMTEPGQACTILGSTICTEVISEVIRDCLVASTAQPTELRLTGGGSAGPLWRQMIADVTGLPVARTTDEQAGARGAAVTAHALAGRDISEVARDLVGTSDPLQPDEANRALYDDAYARFVGMRDAVQAAGWFRRAS